MPQVNSTSWFFSSMKFISTLILIMVMLNYIESSTFEVNKKTTTNFFMLI